MDKFQGNFQFSFGVCQVLQFNRNRDLSDKIVSFFRVLFSKDKKQVKLSRKEQKVYQPNLLIKFLKSFDITQVSIHLF